MFGQIDSFDKKTRQGLIFTGDSSHRLIPFHSDVDWEPGALVQFDVAVVAVNIRKNSGVSPIQAENVPNSAAEAAAEFFRHIDVAAYFGQHGNKIDCGEF